MIDETGQDQAQPSEVDFVALQPGQAIGRYEILSILGQGGFGITYRARDAQLNRDVAIKEYLPSALAVRQDGITVLPRSTKMADDFSWGRQRFVDEGRTLATLQRAPAIVRVFDFLEANGTAYIVMELVPGDTLENRLKAVGKLGPPEIDRILWPLLDGLEQVHATGFLHRDIKPGNILLDGDGNPTLIDFGASRAAMAGRTIAMTAIFTPGYAAGEQMTSAKQGPWTDIYGISATIYHAIVGVPPPSAFDRMLDDAYEPLAKLRPADFSPGLLVGIDNGLIVRGSDRPQSIAGWRPILAQGAALDPQATVALGKTAGPDTTVLVRATAQPAPTVAPDPVQPPPAKSEAMSGKGRWLGLAAVAALVLAGGGYLVASGKLVFLTAPSQTAAVVPTASGGAPSADDAQRQRMQAELDRLRTEKETRDKADQLAAEVRKKAEEDGALKKQIEEQVRAEMAAQQKAEAQTRQKTQAEESIKLKAQEEDRKAAEAAETALSLSPIDRQHVQVALTALGFSTNGTDGVFGGHTRDVIAAWQKSKNHPATTFLTAAENQTLLHDAGSAIAKYDDDQKKSDEAKKKIDEEKAKVDAAASAPKAAAPPAQAAPPPAAAATTPGSGPDGQWRGTFHCGSAAHVGPGGGGGEFSINFQVRIAGGSGTWVRPGSGPGTRGTQSINLRLNGNRITITRIFVPPNSDGSTSLIGTLAAQYDGNIISGNGTETNSGGRACSVNLTR